MVMAGSSIEAEAPGGVTMTIGSAVASHEKTRSPQIDVDLRQWPAQRCVSGTVVPVVGLEMRRVTSRSCCSRRSLIPTG
jgi:hypothetical protein